MEILVYALLGFVILAVGASLGIALEREDSEKKIALAKSESYLEGVSDLGKMISPILASKEKALIRILDELKNKDKIIKLYETKYGVRIYNWWTIWRNNYREGLGFLFLSRRKYKSYNERKYIVMLEINKKINEVEEEVKILLDGVTWDALTNEDIIILEKAYVLFNDIIKVVKPLYLDCIERSIEEA